MHFVILFKIHGIRRAVRNIYYFHSMEFPNTIKKKAIPILMNVMQLLD